MPVSKPRKKNSKQRHPRQVPTNRQPDPVSASGLQFRRFSGFALIGVGLILVMANWLTTAGVDIMPGGHKTLYFVAGLSIAVAGAGLLGIFESN